MSETINVAIRFILNSPTLYEVSKSFIRIPENESRTIIWTIDASNVADGITIAFDNPPITMFGSVEDIEGVTRTDDTHAQLEWTNVPELEGKSFYYRIHMFGRRTEFTETVPEYFAIDHDPTIHNDPPS